MKIDGIHTRTIWLNDDGWSVGIIDQTQLPHVSAKQTLSSLAQAATAIRTMQVRGAPLIGATAAYGICLALRENNSNTALADAHTALLATRPTAVNLRWALQRMRDRLAYEEPSDRVAAAYTEAARICDEDVASCDAIGRHGLDLIRKIADHKGNGEPVNILTHCNAGWLATVDIGTATAPIYRAQEAGINIHVWVGETRPRNQGGALTAYELGQQGIPHTVVVDNTGGHLMQHGMVDICIVGSDRTSANGDVANKIGTYLKALAAADNNIPFHVAQPSSTIDWTISDGVSGIPIEQRDPLEVANVNGKTPAGEVTSVRVIPESSAAANYAFDVTPARLITGLITERGTCKASTAALSELFPGTR